MSSWVAVRQSVMVTVFLAYLVNFILQWIARKSKDQEISDRIRDAHSKVFLFGIVGLFSANLIQGGVYEAISSWVILISLVINHFLNFFNSNPHHIAISHLVFFILLTAQGIGTVVHFLA